MAVRDRPWPCARANNHINPDRLSGLLDPILIQDGEADQRALLRLLLSILLQDVRVNGQTATPEHARAANDSRALNRNRLLREYGSVPI